MGQTNNNVFIEEEEWAPQAQTLERLNQGWAQQFFLTHGHMPRYYIHTYGCQMNEHDSEHLKGLLQLAGFLPGEEKEADLLLFNTCCVREHAETRVFGNVGALLKRKKEQPELVIGVCGCMMQQQQIAQHLFKRFPFVDLVFGTHALPLFPEILARTLENGERVIQIEDSDGRIAETLPTVRKEGPGAFVTVMYGCDNYCSYCIVPYVRGRERSRRLGDVLADIRGLVDGGVSEITLLGQNVNSYGIDLGGDNADFPTLLQRADEIEGLKRIRFMTSHPKDLSQNLIDVVANSKHICHHIHLPVQSGSDKVLQAMNRAYNRKSYLDIVARLRERIPNLDITTDIIVGFPGETEDDFEDTISLVREVGYASAFTFMYSPRKGTPAAQWEDQISQECKKERLLRLNEVQAEMTQKNGEGYMGQTVEILVEGFDKKEGTQAYGRSDSNKMVYFPKGTVNVGDYVPVRITQIRQAALGGEQVQ